MLDSWRLRAACIGTDVGVFFGTQPEQIAEAKAICAACPVTAQCAAFAASERFGVWAGTTPAERCPQRRPGRPRRQPAAA